MLIVDDSLVFREALAMGIESEPVIEVVGKAADAFQARDMILEFKPDVMTCDIQMPKMDGIEFIKRLIPQYPIPIIVITGFSDTVFDAMNAGAIDFVLKPDSKHRIEGFINEVISKIKIAAASKVNLQSITPTSTTSDMTDTQKIIAIGASTGGTEAIFNILKGLPKDIPGIVIVQHIPVVFSKMFANRLNEQTAFSCKEAETGDVVVPGTVFVAPGSMHMKVKKLGGQYRIEVFPGDKVNGHCPSIDVLFESVAQQAGRKALGVILTGMGSDGAKGLLSIRQNGGRTIGQDERSSVVYGMPKAAYNIGAVEKQAALQNIPNVILGMLK
ncbi:chemotaxis response regulator protein-glutamate methylesterase [Bacillus sp. DNRA2]|uniref:protein-glutamate methylesterase/protein-glutamine glutaminase n=1 Tax=Bacillus sp. DNRA2 TaxID=2723053 RepID=UPI0032B87E2A